MERGGLPEKESGASQGHEMKCVRRGGGETAAQLGDIWPCVKLLKANSLRDLRARRAECAAVGGIWNRKVLRRRSSLVCSFASRCESDGRTQ